MSRLKERVQMYDPIVPPASLEGPPRCLQTPLSVQPVLQYYANVGGIGGHALVAGVRTKIDF
jgi:hypothetical protein